MATSEVDICNQALARVGITMEIDALTDATVEAQVCKRNYAQLRDNLLETVDWPFASRRSTLAALSSTRSDWAFVFGLPSDLIAPRELVFMADQTYYYWVFDRPYVLPRPAPGFAIEASDDGLSKVLLCNLEVPELRYTARITDPKQFSPLFTEALVARLAAELAPPLQKGWALRQQYMGEYEAARSKAAAAILNQRQNDPEPDSEMIRVRQ